MLILHSMRNVIYKQPVKIGQYTLLLSRIIALYDTRKCVLHAECIGGLTIQAVSHTLFNIESFYCTPSSHFVPLYINMYHTGPSDDVVPHFTLRLKIYGVTSVNAN